MTNPRSPVVRANAEQWDITSKITGRTYRIYVAKPVTISGAKAAPPEGFPVLYLIDGDFHFHTAAEALTMQSIGQEAKAAYVVGIGYGKGLDVATSARFADLTPFPPDPSMLAALEASPLTKGAVHGEAEAFHRFLTEELRPQIEAAYAVDRSDTALWGHSLGGLFALYALFNHPQAYRTFLINSPSINWNAGAILKDEAKFKASLAAGKPMPRVLLTAGEFEEKLADHVKMHPGFTREQIQAMLTAFGMITNTLDLAKRLTAMDASADRRVEAKVFEAETHLSVIPAAISRGLRFALPM